MKDANLSFAQAIERLRQRRIDWVKAHPKTEVRVVFRADDRFHIVISLPRAVELRMLVFNQGGHDMIRYMVIPEECEGNLVTFNMMRAAIEEDYYQENKQHFDPKNNEP